MDRSEFEEHIDDMAVSDFSYEMRKKLATKRCQGRRGWWNKKECSIYALEKMLVEHVEKGDMIDVGNIAMMIWFRKEFL